MNRYEQLKARQTAAFIVVCTLGLAAVPFVLNWENNIFEGCSFDNGPLHLICKMVSFLILSVIIAVPAFVFYFLILIITTVQLTIYK